MNFFELCSLIVTFSYSINLSLFLSNQINKLIFTILCIVTSIIYIISYLGTHNKGGALGEFLMIIFSIYSIIKTK